MKNEKTLALAWNKGKYDKPITLSSGAEADIRWWRDNIISSWAPIVRVNPEAIITSDACLSGWGATFEEVRTGGLFPEVDRYFEEDELTHINVLESKAVLYGLQALCEQVLNKHIKVLSDNTATVGAINKMGSNKSWQLDLVVTSIWEWALARGNWLTATHIPGKFNLEADMESRKTEHHTERILNKEFFQYVIEELDFQPDIDLFTSHINNQLPRFAAFRPDPEAELIDAFTTSWADLKFYAFPPFICIPRIIQKINLEGATGILIVPDWPNQCWYNWYLSMVTDEVILYPRNDLLHLPSDHKMSKSPNEQDTEVEGGIAQRNRFIPDTATPAVKQLVAQSWALTTQATYNCELKKWFVFCRERNIDPNKPDFDSGIEFLVWLHQVHQAKYSTLANARSAMSAFTPLQDEVSFGKHPLVSRIMKGMFRVRPRIPRRVVTYDTNKIIAFLQTWPDNDQLMLEFLTKKLATLLCILSGQRSQSIGSLFMEHMHQDESMFTFFIPKMLKTTTPTFHQEPLEFVAFPLIPRCCIYRCLQEYIRRTEQIRDSLPKKEGELLPLILSYAYPNLPVKSATLAR